MVSGGTQHYLDGPTYAAFLIPIGIVVGYFAFLVRDYKTQITLKRVVFMFVGATILAAGLYAIARNLPTVQDHHQTQPVHEITDAHDTNPHTH